VLIPDDSGQLGISVLSLRLRQVVLVVAREELPTEVREFVDAVSILEEPCVLQNTHSLIYVQPRLASRAPHGDPALRPTPRFNFPPTNARPESSGRGRGRNHPMTQDPATTTEESRPLDTFRQFFALERDVLVLSAAMFAFSLGFQMTSRYLPEYMIALGASGFVIGLYGTVGNVVSAVYPYPGGAVSD
jgi:hypothetical protein